MNLDIEFKRARREHEIFEKDKTSEINRLLRLKDLKESNLQRELKNLVSSLQEEVKVKEERYKILLEKFDSYQKEQRDNEAKVVTEILTKSQANDPQNRALQETISNILNRLNDLEKKPMVQIDHIVNHEHEEHSEIVYNLQNVRNVVCRKSQN